MSRPDLRLLVAQAAAKQLPSLPPRNRADLIEGISLLLVNPTDKEFARYTAGLIRQADELQLRFVQRLATPTVRNHEP
jgi:hypothetical protein